MKTVEEEEEHTIKPSRFHREDNNNSNSSKTILLIPMTMWREASSQEAGVPKYRRGISDLTREKTPAKRV
jgi:hypothetical protein